MINALLLMCTSLVMRTVGVSFNVYVSNKIGAAGMGLFTLVMSVYAFAVTFATSGVNLAAARLTAEALGHNSDNEVKSVMKRCIIYSLCFGTCAAVILYISSSYIGEKLLNDIRTVPSLRLLALSLPFIALSSALHGYFNAIRRVIKSAVAQIFEQLVKIVLTSVGLTLLMPKGLEYSCLAVVGGASLAEVSSFLFILILYIFDLKYKNTGKGEIKSKLTSNLLSISIPVALSAYVRSGLITLEHLLVPYGLRRSGSSGDKALESYGILHGMVIPIVMFPQAFIASFSGLLVPELAESRTKGDEIHINYIIGRVIQITLCFAVGVSGIMICFAYELGGAVYNNYEASHYILMMSPLIPVMYLDNVVDSMLKGLNEQLYSMRVNIVDSCLSVVLVYFLLPSFGIYGYVWIIYGCEIINASMSITRLMSVADFKIKPIQWLIMPLLCVAGSTACTSIIFTLSGILFINNGISTAVHIIVSAFLYFVFLRLTSSITSDDICWIKGIIAA